MLYLFTFSRSQVLLDCLTRRVSFLTSGLTVRLSGCTFNVLALEKALSFGAWVSLKISLVSLLTRGLLDESFVKS